MTKPLLTYSLKRDVLRFRTGTGFVLRGKKGGVLACDKKVAATVAGTNRRSANSRFHVERTSETTVEFWQSIRNPGPRPLDISAIRMFDGRMDLEGSGWRVAHSELFKRDLFFDYCGRSTGNLLAPIPGVEGEFGLSEDWPFPGLFLTHPERGTVLMATVSQDRCKPFWTLRRKGRTTAIEAVERFTGVARIRVAPGGEWTTERWLMLYTPGGLEEAVEQYYRILRKRMAFQGARSVLRRAVVWGTWNYNDRPRGHYDITHAYIAANARALTALVPDKPRIAMIDDGYQYGRSQPKDKRPWFSSCLEIFHKDGNPAHDPMLFPKGMKGMADDIRKAGVMPALWTTTRLNRESNLVKDRPEWRLRCEGKLDFRGRAAYLDYSLPEVREFTREAWRTVFQTWGYEGMKLDFWSLPFEIPQVRYRRRDRTGVELRNLFLQDLREFVPRGGFLLVAVVTNTGGNPFVGRYADAARMGTDIGNGTFPEVRQSAYCLTAAAPFYRHDCLLGDPDSIGWSPKNTPGHNRLNATAALLSGAMCEIGGALTALTPDARAMLRTVARIHGPARRTVNGITTAGPGNLPAERIVREQADGVYEGILNWMPWPREIRLARPVLDLWTGRRLKDADKIPAEDAILFKRR